MLASDLAAPSAIAQLRAELGLGLVEGFVRKMSLWTWGRRTYVMPLGEIVKFGSLNLQQE